MTTSLKEYYLEQERYCNKMSYVSLALSVFYFILTLFYLVIAANSDPRVLWVALAGFMGWATVNTFKSMLEFRELRTEFEVFAMFEDSRE